MRSFGICDSVACLILVASMQGCGKTEDSAKTQDSAVVVANSIQVEDLIGNWAAGTGRGTIIKLPDGSLQLVNDHNDVSRGEIHGKTLECQEWSVTGQLSVDKKIITWSNGSVWNR